MNESVEYGIPWQEQPFDLAPMPPLPLVSSAFATTEPINGNIDGISCTDTQTMLEAEKLKRKREAARVRQQRCRHRKKAEIRARLPATVALNQQTSTSTLFPDDDFTSTTEMITMPPLVPLVVPPQQNSEQGEPPDLTSEEKLIRKREAARIRQQRYRARKKSNGQRSLADASITSTASLSRQQNTPAPTTPCTVDRFNLNNSHGSKSYYPGSVDSSIGVPSFLAMLGDADALASHIDGDVYIEQIVADV
jgi:hypothetical protein